MPKDPPEKSWHPTFKPQKFHASRGAPMRNGP